MLCSKQLLKLSHQCHFTKLKHARYFSINGFWIAVAHSAPVVNVQSGLIYAQSVVGTGHWPLDIITGALIFRNFISLPIGTIQRTIITQHAVKVKRKMDVFSYRLNEAVKNKEMSREEAKTLGMKQARELGSIRKWFDPEYNTFKKVGPLFAFEICLWLMYTISLRNTVTGIPTIEARVASLEMRQQSFAWIQDITLSDPLLILPLITCITTLTSLRYMREWRRQNGMPESILFKAIHLVAPPALVFAFIIASTFPAAVNLHFSTSATFGLIHSHIYCQPWFHRMIGTPEDLVLKKLSFKKWLSKHK